MSLYNLPASTVQDSAQAVKAVFDQYQTQSVTYPSNQVDAVVSFFEKRGFDSTAAISTASVLLQQSKIDNVNVFKLLDTLEGFDEVQLNLVVAGVLNANRDNISTLGFRVAPPQTQVENRNIMV